MHVVTSKSNEDSLDLTIIPLFGHNLLRFGGDLARFGGDLTRFGGDLDILVKNDNIEGGLQRLISPNCENGKIDEGNDKFEEENSGLKAILVGLIGVQL